MIIQADGNIGSLSNIVGHKHWRAEAGVNGQGSLKQGGNGKDAMVMVPPGTLVLDDDRGHLLKDLAEHGDTVVVAQGGKGGHGNKHFATSTNRAPREHEEGEPGQLRNVRLELKLIADVGLIGLPNAGKSTLLSRMSRAHPEIADYPFTTKYPNLGLVRAGYDQQFVMADIPGLIEGAHAGVGLGHEFLRHVERTRVLVHMVEPSPMDQSDPIENFQQIRRELELYDDSLSKRPEIVAVSKCELPDAAPAAELLEETLGRPVLQISAVTGRGLPELFNQILELLRQPQEVDGSA